MLSSIFANSIVLLTFLEIELECQARRLYFLLRMQVSFATKLSLSFQFFKKFEDFLQFLLIFLL